MSDISDGVDLDAVLQATQQHGSGSDDSGLPEWLTSQALPEDDAFTPDSLSDEFNDTKEDAPWRGEAEEPAGVEADGEGQGSLPTSQPVGKTSQRPKPADGILDRNEITVVLPEKIYRNKVLVELEPAGHNATDLSGDAGAVGRLLVSGKPGNQELRMDLKGVVYKASILPLAGSVCIINLGTAEAKVETLVNNYMRLKEESSMMDAEALLEGQMPTAIGSDDEDDEMPPPGDKGGKGDKRKADRADGQTAAKKPKGRGTTTKAAAVDKAKTKSSAIKGAGSSIGQKPKASGSGGKAHGKTDAFNMLMASKGGAKSKAAKSDKKGKGPR